jgi:hypothetical protein
MREKMNADQRSNSSNDEYVVELLHRAMMNADQNARVKVQQCLCGTVRSWFHRHPHREALCRLDSEENFVNVTFERFWKVAIDKQIECNSLTTALQYLRASLNGTILDRMRASSRLKEVALPGTGFPEEFLLEYVSSSAEIWERDQRQLLNVREQRLAYLLFHCGLKPKEIIQCCSQEFSDVCEIYHLRRNIIERILCNVDHLR